MVDLNELNLEEKLEDSFITQVIYFRIFSSSNILDLVLVSEPEIFKWLLLGHIMTAHKVLELNLAYGFNEV